MNRLAAPLCFMECWITRRDPNQGFPYLLIYVAAAIARWVRGEEYGVEALVIDDESQDELGYYLAKQVRDTMVFDE